MENISTKIAVRICIHASGKLNLLQSFLNDLPVYQVNDSAKKVRHQNTDPTTEEKDGGKMRGAVQDTPSRYTKVSEQANSCTIIPLIYTLHVLVNKQQIVEVLK